MEFIKSHILPVVVAVVATWIAGFIWSRTIFSLQENPDYSRAQLSSFQHVGDIGHAALIAWIMFYTEMHTILEGIFVAFVVWVGYVLAVAGHLLAFHSMNRRFFVISVGGVLFSLVVAGAVLGAILKEEWVRPISVESEQ